MTTPRAGALRPSISPLLWAGLGAWAGSYAGAYVWWFGAASGMPAELWGWAAVAAMALVAGVSYRGKRIAVFALACGIAVGLGCALAHGAWLRGCAKQLERGGVVERTGIAVADAVRGPYGVSVDVRLTGAAASGAVASVALPDDAGMPLCGEALAFSGRTAMVAPASESGRRAWMSGRVLRCRAWKVRGAGWSPGIDGVAGALRARALAVLRGVGSPGRPVVASALLGYRAETVGTPLEDDFRSSGIAYALVLSGLHLALAAEMAAYLARVAGASRRAQAVCGLAVAATLACGCGLRPALLRALAVALAGRTAAFVGRRRDATAGTGAALLGVLALDPTAATDVGFAIGVTAVLGIALFAGLVRGWIAPLLPRRAYRVASPLAAATAAQAAIAPVAAVAFAAVSPLGPLSAVIAVPFLQLALLAGLPGVLLASVSPRAASAVFALACLPAACSATTAHAIAGIPGAVVPLDVAPITAVVCGVAGAVGLWLWWPRPRRAWRVRAGALALAAALAISGGCTPYSSASITVLDVGQGDSILVRDGSSAMLVDCGPDATALRQALARARVRSLDAVVLTHEHADHIGGARGLSGITRPRWVGIPGCTGAGDAPGLSSLGDAAPMKLVRDMRWRVGSWDVRVLWPTADAHVEEANDRSVVLLLQRGEQRALLLGDAEAQAQEGALAAFAGRVDVLKVAHHGSVNGAVAEPLAAWSPREALISVGAGNRFGHPRAEALRALSAVGARIWRTDLNGDITVCADASPWRISVSRGAAAVGAAESPRYATIGRRWHALRPTVPDSATKDSTNRGRQRPLGTQAGLPHSRLRGAAAGARGPPTSRPRRFRRRPRLQPGGLRGRPGER